MLLMCVINCKNQQNEIYTKFIGFRDLIGARNLTKRREKEYKPQ